MGLYILQLVEGTEEAELGGGVLLRVSEWTAVGCSPRRYRFFRQEDTDGISQLAIRGDVEDEFRRGGLRIVGKRGALADEIVLVDVALSARVGL